jgi:hypothetical protein
MVPATKSGLALCRRAGFRQVRLRGDTDFSQTRPLDRWDAAGVKFLFGIQAMSSLDEHVENLPQNAWKELVRSAKDTVKTEPRRRPANAGSVVLKSQSNRSRGFRSRKQASLVRRSSLR